MQGRGAGHPKDQIFFNLIGLIALCHSTSDSKYFFVEYVAILVGNHIDSPQWGIERNKEIKVELKKFSNPNFARDQLKI